MVRGRGAGGQAGHGAWKQGQHPSKGRYKAIRLALKSSLIAPEGVTADSVCTKGNASALARTAEITNCARSGLSPIKGQSEHQK